MIYLSNGRKVVVMLPDDTPLSAFPSKNIVYYDQISFIANTATTKIGEDYSFDDLQPDPSPLPKIYLRVTVSGGDGKTPPGINQDAATNPLIVEATLQAIVNDEYMLLPISHSWRIPFTGASGDIYREVSFVNGYARFVLQTESEGMFAVDTTRFEPVDFGGVKYQVEIIGETTFVSYRVAPEVIA